MDADEPQEKGKPELRPINKKIAWLIRHMWPADQPPAESDRDVARVISEATGEKMSYSLIWQLRTGRAANPTFKVLTALSSFFGVPVGYFDDGEQGESIQEQLDALAVMKEAGMSRASLRMLAGMSAEGRESVADMIETVARRERRRAEGSASS
ncbi:MAG: hypothetical protein J2P25_09125 [Nocardiopsaceae bacterium]|nr:hypothetical protein [Nocardiopsaceae bacterium]